MDVVGLSMANFFNKVQSDVGIAMLSKTMDSNESMGQGIVDMIEKASMERSVNPFVGGNFDMSV